MRWPFTTQARLEEAVRSRDKMIDLLTRQVEDLTQERRRLADYIALRSGPVSLYDIVKVPREEESEAPAKAADLQDLPPSKARLFAQQQEKANLASFEKEENEARKLIADAIAEGKAAAEQNAKS